MAELGVVTRALLAIAREIRDDRMLAAEICRACVEGLDVDGAAISVFTTSTMRETLCVTDATADRLEDLQFTLGEGACMDAAATGRPVLIPDMNDPTDTARWPIYAAAVVQQTGVGAVFALPLQWGTINLGVLDLYRRAPGPLPRDQLRDALSAAATATLMLLGLHTDPGDDQAWDVAWGHRAEIHQATGMVVAQLGINAQDAFARLRAFAFAEQRLLSDVARDVVQRKLRFDNDTS
jgi:ANTAR domain/GAF domain